MIDWVKIKKRIVKALDRLYREDECLFSRNNGKGLAERCIVFRFAHYLQNGFDDYFVDCDFNSSFYGQEQLSGKTIRNSDGSTTSRFIDIIIHKRDFNCGSGIANDLVCFEIKKWNNKKRNSVEKDKNNLRVLTSEYGYKYGFFIILGKTIGDTTIEVYGRNGSPRSLRWEGFRDE